MEAVLLQTFLVGAVLTATSAKVRPDLGGAAGRLATMVVLLALETTVVLAVLFAALLAVFVAIDAATGHKPTASAGPVEMIIAIIVVSPFYGRWLGSAPLVMDEFEGPVSSIRRSWRATRGSSLRCGFLAFVGGLPFIALAASPDSIPWVVFVIPSVFRALIPAAISVAVYRQPLGFAAAIAPQPEAPAASAPPPVAGLGWLTTETTYPFQGLVRRYEARYVRRMSPKWGVERAELEGPAAARFQIATFIFVAPVPVRLLSPDLALLTYLLGLAWLPVVILTWRSYRRAHKAFSGMPR